MLFPLLSTLKNAFSQRKMLHPCSGSVRRSAPDQSGRHQDQRRPHASKPKPPADDEEDVAVHEDVVERHVLRPTSGGKLAKFAICWQLLEGLFSAISKPIFVTEISKQPNIRFATVFKLCRICARLLHSKLKRFRELYEC